MKSFLLFGIALLLLQSCEYGILYDQPQPGGIENLNNFPQKLIGKYCDDSSNVDIVIEKNRVIKISYYDIEASKAEIDTLKDCKLIGDSLFLGDVQQFIHVDIINDSVFGVLTTPDTLFTISQFNILRKLKSDYFLSLIHESGNWQVIRLRQFKKENIEFSVIPQSVDFDKLNSITPIEQLKDHNDSILNYKVSPTFKQFEGMIRQGLFNKSEVYHKVKSGK